MHPFSDDGVFLFALMFRICPKRDIVTHNTGSLCMSASARMCAVNLCVSIQNCGAISN